MTTNKAILGIVFLTVASLSGCVSQTIKTTSIPRVETPSAPPAEAELLDVSIAVFNPGLDQETDDPVFPEVREAESRFMPQLLMAALQESGAWGAVRVVPSEDQLTDLMITGKILQSDGKELALEISAFDATGRFWINNRVYQEEASRYAYAKTTRRTHDAFQALYNRIANDLLSSYQRLTSRDRAMVRQVAEMRFAERFASAAFSDYVLENGERYTLQKLPAEGDPMLERVRKIRARDHLYVDTLQGYYRQFNTDMLGPYQEWRKLSYEEALALEQVQAEARKDLLLGGAAVLAGIYASAKGSDAVTRTAGNVAIMGGGYMIKSGLDKRNEAAIHVEALQELGASLEAEVTPQIIQLDDQTITLSGNVQDQYAQWRALLDELYETEIGSLPELNAKDTGDASEDVL
jgi:hypothetical protein